METVQQNGRLTLFSNKFNSKIYSIIFGTNRQTSPIYTYIEDIFHKN